MMSFRSRVAFSAQLGLLVLLAAGTALAQTTTGTISGTVKDSSGLVLPNAQIEVLNQDTGITRAMQSDAAGRYSAVLLPLGNYKVTAQVQGFQTEARDGIVLTVGREAVVDLTMSVGSTTSTVEVHAEATLINTTSAEIQGLVSGEQIRELPLNGRSYNDLALLNPGVIYNNKTGGSSSDGYGVRMSVNGARANNNLFLIDGTMTNDTSQTAGTVNADSLGVEGIREFVILTHNYSAEFGHSAGGVVNAVTRSGTNQFHGSLYEFLRNSAVDARDFFQTGPVAPFRRNQFGGAIGGPVKKDKLFFFSNYEGFRQSLAIPSPASSVPNADARKGNIPCAITNLPCNASTGFAHVVISPTQQKYLNLYPLPNGPDNGDGTGVFNFNAKQPIVENYNMERVDLHISDKDNFYARYIYDPSNRLRFTANIGFWSTQDNANNYFSQIGETHIFSPNAVNDFRAAFNRTFRGTTIGPVNPLVASLITPDMSFVPGLPLGRMPNSVLPTLGNLNATPAINLQNLFEEGDTFTLVHGRHSFKFGFDLQRIQVNQFSGGGTRVSWTFGQAAGVGGLQSFLAGQPSSLDAGTVIGTTSLGTLSLQNFGWRQWLPSWFIQDDWKVTSRLTLNLGLRHEFYTDLREVNGHSGTLVNLTDTASTIGLPFHTAKMNFAPRFGLAWDPTGSGKTAIRFGLGIYFNQVSRQEAGASDYQFSATYSFNCNWTDATKPNLCATYPLAPASPPLSSSKTESIVQNPLPTPTIIQYGLDIQRQLTATMTLRVGYVGWYGYHLTRYLEADTRMVNPATGLFSSSAPTLNPGFSSIPEIRADTVANYNALQADFQKALSTGLTFRTSYTYSKALAEADSTQNRISDNTANGYVSFDPLNPGRDYGRSGYDQRHTVVVSAQYDLPFAKGLNGRLQKAVLGGWAVSGIWSYGSGIPLNINTGFNRSLNGDNKITTGPDRPNLNPGFTNPSSGVTAGCKGIPAGQPLGTPDRWYDPCAFSLPPAGTYGNLGRNTLNGPGTDKTSFAVVKNTALTERMKLQFRAEFFNLFNHPQFNVPNDLVFSSSGAYAATAGRITLTDGTVTGLGGRNIQFGMKLTF
jgi:hypothetical protein